ncbi:MAG TPA: hypothetical protein VHR45_06400 [Thermoanaerobaculia bacterium]|nr:hypothetical protein [Thermoanaerobaculia bacterium]
MQIMMAVLVALATLFLLARLRYPGKTTVKLPAGNCNADLWKHVYLAERLRVIEACTAVDGRVVSVRGESDGDLHLALDPEDTSVLNLMNATHVHGDLVAEVICEHTPADGDAATACAAFTSRVAIPKIGDRVRVTGAYVTDRNYGWNELHPVTRIETLR